MSEQNSKQALSRRDVAALLVAAVSVSACGDAGQAGTPGQKGADGAQGERGPQGAKGADGLPGKGVTGVLSALDFGAVGDGVADDTSALQKAIDEAQKKGSQLVVPAGNYRLTDTLRITAHLMLVGAGYQADSGKLYASVVETAEKGFLGTTLLPPADKTAIAVTTNDPVTLTDFMILWPQSKFPAALSGVAGIQIQSTDGNSGNTASVIQRVCIYGADRGVVFTNCTDFMLLYCTFLMSQTYGVVVTTVPGPQYWQNGGDWLAMGNTFYSGSSYTGGAAAIYIQGTAGKILGNKIQPSSGSVTPFTCVGILIVPDATLPGRVIEPMVVSGNSIEGNHVGILYFQNAPSDAIAALGMITGNQIWCETAVRVATNGNYSVSGLPVGVWVVGLTITGNVFQMQGDASVGIDADGLQLATIVGNTFALTGGATGTGVRLGAHTNTVNVQSNVYAPGVTPVSNTGTSNVIGGGSP